MQWPARFQSWNNHIVIDGAHNPAGAAILVKTWQEQFGRERATIILAVLDDKDAAGIWSALAPIAHEVILPSIRTDRALSPQELANIGRQVCPQLSISISPSLADAIAQAQSQPARVLITGSLHFAGEALATLEGKAAAFEECAQ